MNKKESAGQGGFNQWVYDTITIDSVLQDALSLINRLPSELDHLYLVTATAIRLQLRSDRDV